MRYTEFRELIREELEGNPAGKTWKQLRENLNLPYRNPCPEWVNRLEKEIGLDRTERMGKALLWRIN